MAQRFVCFKSNQVTKSIGLVRKLFHNDEIITLSFADIGKAQDVLPHLGNRTRLLTLSGWESQCPYSIDTIIKKLEFKGIESHVVDRDSEGNLTLIR